MTGVGRSLTVAVLIGGLQEDMIHYTVDLPEIATITLLPLGALLVATRRRLHTRV